MQFSNYKLYDLLTQYIYGPMYFYARTSAGDRQYCMLLVYVQTVYS